MSDLLTPEQIARHEKINAAGSLLTLLDDPDGRKVLDLEADDLGLDDARRLVTRPALDHLTLLRANRAARPQQLGLFGSDDVLIVPGFMGSALKDVSGSHGLIWIGPGLFFGKEQVAALRLAGFEAGKPDVDAESGVRIESPGAVPAIYDVLWADLNFRGYDPVIAPFDWRKDLERSAAMLADRIRERLGRRPRPLHLIAHSQGALVARRAVQLLGADQARRLINNLVLLGPASFGTFSAAFALAGSHESFAVAKKYGVKLPDDYSTVFQSFTGLYQLLPWDPKRFLKPAPDSPGFDPLTMGIKSFWGKKTAIETSRLKYGFGWGRQIDTSFFDERTSIILGDQPTVGAVKFVDGQLLEDEAKVQGDGTVPDFLAKIPGVRRVYRAGSVDHMTLPMHLSVLGAVRAILRGDTPAIEDVQRGRPLGISAEEVSVPRLKEPPASADTFAQRARIAPPAAVSVPSAGASTGSSAAPLTPMVRREYPRPPCHRLRIFSFDPLLGTHLETLAIARITIEIRWEPESMLTEGPVGEYIEVVDYDPATGCFYQPVDLTHPKLTAQDGLPPAESDPQFHQQMTYAVAMATIETFEKALGRVALWAPHLVRDADGEVVDTPLESQYVPRLRIYPHALREANAYYDPSRHALLFGYFPSKEQPGGETMPGGTVFACQSFDIIAHETTHALLHGLRPYYLVKSNSDVLAFHEAFADAVALFQHFSHKEVVRNQVAKTRGDLRTENLLGNLAWQFGQATGLKRGGLRRYITQPPDPDAYAKAEDPHDRGAVLMAALFRAFQNIYAHRSRDLYQIAAGDLRDGVVRDLHPALVNRLAVEASKSARHILTMCVRALDYLPPVDITFGEYLRALITADHDMVPDDDLGYRVAVIDAFRSWGIYPANVNVLDEPALLWDLPDQPAKDNLRGVLRDLNLGDWTPKSDRRSAFLRITENAAKFRRWLFISAARSMDDGDSLGIKIFGTSCQSIPRNDRDKNPLPKFHVHSVRPCLRLGPHGEQRNDVVVELVQRRAGYSKPEVQELVDSARTPWAFTARDLAMGRPSPPRSPDFWFLGGCTLLIDLDTGEIRYCIKKSIRADARLHRQRGFERTNASSASAMYFGANRLNPFAMLHADE